MHAFKPFAVFLKPAESCNLPAVFCQLLIPLHDTVYHFYIA